MVAFEVASAPHTTASQSRPATPETRAGALHTTASQSRPATTEPGVVEAHATALREHLLHGRPVDASAHTQSVGVIIPGVFSVVAVEVVDTEGARLTDVFWLVSADTFPTATVARDGVAHIWLLNAPYTEFFVVVPEGEGPDLTWYSAAAQEPIHPLHQETGTVVIEPEPLPAQGTPLNVSGGFSVGRREMQ